MPVPRRQLHREDRAHPARPGPRTGNLTVTEDVVGGTSVTSPLLGQGGEPQLEPTYSGLDFPATAVGSSSVTRGLRHQEHRFRRRRIVAHRHGRPSRGLRGHGQQLQCDPDQPEQHVLDVAFTPTEAGHRTASVLALTEFGQYTSVLVNGDGIATPSSLAEPVRR
ncbi:MAG: hypothetical protein R2713_24205 [Ilumatobacteraceae bacterium]